MRYASSRTIHAAHSDCIAGHRLAQIRVVFSLPKRSRVAIFGDRTDIPEHLAYVEWFSPFKSAPEANSLLYKVNRSLDQDGHRISSIIPVSAIRQTLHLFPLANRTISDSRWTSTNVLDMCNLFLLNSFSSRYAYYTLV